MKGHFEAPGLGDFRADVEKTLHPQHDGMVESLSMFVFTGEQYFKCEGFV